MLVASRGPKKHTIIPPKDQSTAPANGEVITRVWTEEERQKYTSIPKPREKKPSMSNYDHYAGNPKYRNKEEDETMSAKRGRPTNTAEAPNENQSNTEKDYEKLSVFCEELKKVVNEQTKQIEKLWNQLKDSEAKEDQLSQEVAYFKKLFNDTNIELSVSNGKIRKLEAVLAMYLGTGAQSR